MRGRESRQPSIFIRVTVDSFVPDSHPLRGIKELTEVALRRLSRDIGRSYAKRGRPSIPPEQLLKSQLLMSLYGVSSERGFCEQLRYNMLFRWFVGLELDEEPFVATVFTKNRERFMRMDIGKKLFDAVVLQASDAGLLSSEHFSVDGSLIEASASMKSFRPKDDDDDGDSNGWADFSGKKRSNETHESKTDGDSRLMKKGRGKEARLSFQLNVLSENRNGLILNLHATIATGRSEREGAIELLDGTAAPMRSRATLGADRGYDASEFFDAVSKRGLRPHVAIQHTGRKKALLDKRTTNSVGYQLSQIYRRKVEGVIGWLKHPGRMKRARLRGVERVDHLTYFAGAAHNLLRIVNLGRQRAAAPSG